ncbi:ABC transporter-associated permease [Acidipropionibacterium acidipropionici ATCC 4875]|uniref:ABC transporter-associated permease n=1 Tax=Acidipropionibacterium acidipropionici (strain ATCC 4875 / DSM 20272 / JCM 6432 / NBRC 12425 / NCIMB 8070 / 4) TaxID=1171373 RepID=K7RV77_ACIA4|nr:energy-coupling factor transporter transmembrane component T [Acidipropionibacterium acidipropionici]AFV90301.1 ABC transporter-associated permease [Acidipropionibacterium acidipropionici ATCC 4875]
MPRLLERPADPVLTDDGAGRRPSPGAGPLEARPGRPGGTNGSTRTAGGAPTHPVAWWAWALATGAAVSMTTSPLLIVLVIAALALVVANRRSDAPWARSAGTYITLALSVIIIRMVFQILLGGSDTGTVLVQLPRIPLPLGVTLGGPVTAEGLATTGYDALRLATMLACFGAANTLADPRGVLKSVPAALHDISVAVVIALSVFPQLIVSVARVRRARRLRGGRAKGLRALTSILIPVLQDAVESSMDLSRAMESRGFGRTRDNRRVRPGTATGLVASMCGLVIGVYLLLTDPRWASAPRLSAQLVGAVVLGLSAIGAVAGLRSSGRRLRVTRYRPHRWTPRSIAVIGCGLLVVICTAALNSLAPAAVNPSTSPLEWPVLHPLMLGIAALVAAPAFLTSPPRRARAAQPRQRDLPAQPRQRDLPAQPRPNHPDRRGR